MSQRITFELFGHQCSVSLGNVGALSRCMAWLGDVNALDASAGTREVLDEMCRLASCGRSMVRDILGQDVADEMEEGDLLAALQAVSAIVAAMGSGNATARLREAIASIVPKGE